MTDDRRLTRQAGWAERVRDAKERIQGRAGRLARRAAPIREVRDPVPQSLRKKPAGGG